SERHRLRPRAALVATAPPFGAAPCRVSAQNPRMNNKTVRRAMWVSIAAFGFSLTAAAQHADHEPLPPVATELHPGLGDYHFPITTSNPDAQVYFDQGIRLLYGFNHDEAARYFRRAAELDPAS